MDRGKEMEYKTEEKSFDNYLINLRGFKMKEFELSTKYKGAKTGVERLSVQRELADLSVEVKHLKNSLMMESRNYDVFRSSPELKVEIFERENPEPSMPERCRHSDTGVRLRSFEDGSKQLVSQCTGCGIQTRSHRKNSVPDWTKVEVFNEVFPQPHEDEHARWTAARYKVITDAMHEGSEIPDFDDAGFRAGYELKNPRPPFATQCEHAEFVHTKRIYPSGASAVVAQCKSCGHHIKTISKKDLKDTESLSAFDEGQKNRFNAIASNWHEAFSVAWKKAHSEYVSKTQSQIWNGEIKYQDNTRFGTYYVSEEWFRTRLRILDRDNGECQACMGVAQCVHHIVYERLGCENDLDLIALCNQCHDKVHKIQRGYPWQFRLTPSEIRGLQTEEKWNDA